MKTPDDAHADRIREQFTKQAEPFAAFHIRTLQENLEALREELRLAGGEHLLDAGCGPGLVVAHLAPFVREVVGVDATPAMLEKGREVARQKGAANVVFQEATMETLPFAAGTFDGVVTRYTFHHLLDPGRAFDEMVRVCRPGRRVVVCDVAPRPACRAAYDDWERMRDPSHTSARTPDELRALAESRLRDVTTRSFRLDNEVDALIARSFPADEDRPRLRAAMQADVGVDALDMGARLVDGRLHMSFPVLVIAGTAP